MVSDFQDGGYEKLLRVARRRYDLIPIAIGDPREAELPNVGLIELVDGETGELVLVDTASRRFREEYAARAAAANQRRREMFRRMDLDPIELTTGRPFVEPLMRYFRKKHARS